MQSEEYDNVLFSFLGCVMKTPELLYESRLTPAMIGNSQDGSSLPARMFSILQNQVDKHISVDYRTVYDEISAISGSDSQFPSSKAFNMLEEINHYVASSANWKYFESRLLDHWAQKRIDDVCKMVQEIKGPSVTAQDKVSHLEKAIAEINLVETEFNIVTIRESLHGVVEKIEERYKNKDLIGISTGIDLLDSSTYGFQPGQFWVIGGRPSQGKSALMGQLHRNIAMRKKEACGVISIESSISEIGMRNFSAEGKIDATRISSGYLKSSDFSTIQDVTAELYALDDKIVYYDKPALSLSELRSVAKRMVRKHKSKVIFVDYLQLVEIPDSNLSIFQIVAKVSKGLKSLARELKICIVALAQLGRDADDGRPGIKDFQYSSQIEQDADVALMLWHFNQETSEKDNLGNPITRPASYIIIGKARDGIVTDIPVIFDKSIMTFKEIDKNAQ